MFYRSGDLISKPLFSIVNFLSRSDAETCMERSSRTAHLIGALKPECDGEGNFKEVQCHGKINKLPSWRGQNSWGNRAGLSTVGEDFFEKKTRGEDFLSTEKRGEDFVTR